MIMPEHLADRAAGEAVDGRAEGDRFKDPSMASHYTRRI